jgi:hypothetical protein
MLLYNNFKLLQVYLSLYFFNINKNTVRQKRDQKIVKLNSIIKGAKVSKLDSQDIKIWQGSIMLVTKNKKNIKAIE